MSQTTRQTIQVTGHNKFGVLAVGFPKAIYLSKRLKDSGEVPTSVPIGMVDAEIWTSDTGVHYFNSYKLASGGTGQAPSAPVQSVPIPVADVVPVKGHPEKEGMSKADWAKKDVNISCQAIWKSVFESPALATSVVGNSPTEIAAKLSDAAELATNRYLAFVATK